MRSKPCPICRGDGEKERQAGDYCLLKCRQCRFVYVDATDEEIFETNLHYDDEYLCRYAKTQSSMDFLWFKRITTRLTSGRDGLNVLDIGCGNGVLLRQFQDRGCVCYGSDPSPWAAKCAHQYGYTLLPCIEEADIESGFFDIITSTSALEHMATPLEHIRHIVRLLKPGGIAYFTVPNYGSLPIRLHIVEGRLITPPVHCNYFTIDTLRNLFARRGIAEHLAKTVVRSYGIPESYGIYRWLSRKRPGDAAGKKSKTEIKPKYGWPMKALVSIYYWCGTLGGLGDKLEAWIEKAKLQLSARMQMGSRV